MLKLAAVILVSMLVHVSYGIYVGSDEFRVGGYMDHPVELKHPTDIALANYAAEYLASTQGLVFNTIKLIRVQTQVVAGTNYIFSFTGEPVNQIGDTRKICEVHIFLGFDSTKRVQKVQCQ